MSETSQQLKILNKERRKLWRAIRSGKCDADLYRPHLGKLLDLILDLQHREKLYKAKK